MKRRVVVKKSVLPASQDVIWEKLQQLATLQYIAKTFVSFSPQGRAGDVQWEEGKTFLFTFRLFCLIPLGTHIIRIVRFQREPYEIQSQEANGYVPVWNHKIVLRKLGPDRTEYSDEVELYAGWKTPAVWLWAHCFYAHTPCPLRVDKENGKSSCEFVRFMRPNKKEYP